MELQAFLPREEYSSVKPQNINVIIHCLVQSGKKIVALSLFPPHSQGLMVTKVPFIAPHFIGRGWNKTVTEQCCLFSSISDI